MENANEVKTVIQEKEKPAASSRKPTIILVIAGLLLVVGGLLWLAVNKYQQPAIPVSPQAEVSPQAPTPTPATLDEELNSITIEETDSDFATIDSDLGNL